MSKLFANLKLQSPFWQGIGVIVSIFSLLISTFIAYDIYQKSAQFSELTLEKTYSFNPVYFGEDAKKRVAMIVDDEIASEVTVYSYSLKNTGKAPIIPSDYTEPIKISVKKPFKILTVETEEPNPETLSVVWDRVNEDSFQIKPLLLNPGDSFKALIFVSDSSTKISERKIVPVSKKVNNKSKIESIEIEIVPNKTTIQGKKGNSQGNWHEERKVIPEPIWGARIVNIQKLNFTTPQAGREAEKRSLGIFYATVYHTGWSVYRFAAFTLLLFVFGLFCGVQFGVLQKVSFAYYFLLSVLMALSTASGETLANILQSGTHSGETWISNLSLILYMLLIFFFTLPAVKNIFYNSTPSNNPNQPTTGGNNGNP